MFTCNLVFFWCPLILLVLLLQLTFAAVDSIEIRATDRHMEATKMICMFGGHLKCIRTSTPRSEKPAFFANHKTMRAAIGASSRSLTLQIEDSERFKGYYRLTARSEPFKPVLIRDNQLTALGGIVPGDVKVQDGDILIIRVPTQEERPWDDCEDKIVDTYNQSAWSRLTVREERLVRRMIQKSSAFSISRVHCLSGLDFSNTFGQDPTTDSDSSSDSDKHSRSSSVSSSSSSSSSSSTSTDDFLSK